MTGGANLPLACTVAPAGARLSLDGTAPVLRDAHHAGFAVRRLPGKGGGGCGAMPFATGS